MGGRRVLLSVVILAAAVVAAIAFRLVDAPEALTTSLDESSAPISEPLEALDSADSRRVYPYSIIPGGAETVEELEKAIDADPVVANHFAAFDLSRTRVETLDRPRVAYVSYRNGQDVFWTRKPVVIPAGERVLTDGTNTARVRCGNCLSESPGPVSADEPPAEVLDTPQPPKAGVAPPSDSADPDGSDPTDPGSGGPNPDPSSTPGGVPVGPGFGPAPTSGGGAPPGPGGPGGSPGGSGGPSIGAGVGGVSAGPSGTSSSGTAPGASGGPAGPGGTGIPPGGDLTNPGTSPGPHSGPSLPPPGGFPPSGSGPGGPWLPPGPDGNWPPPGGSTWPPGGPPLPPGLGDFPGSGDPQDFAGPGDPGDPSDDPHGEDDDPKSIPEPGTTALMLFGAAWIARRKLRAR